MVPVLDNVNFSEPRQFAKSCCCLPKRHGQCTWKTMLHNITEVTDNLVKVR